MESFADALARAESACATETIRGGYEAELARARARLDAAVAEESDRAFIAAAAAALRGATRVALSARPAEYRAGAEAPALPLSGYVAALRLAGDVHTAASDRMAAAETPGAPYDPAANAARVRLLNRFAESYTTALQFDPQNDALKLAVSAFYVSLARTAEKASVADALGYARFALRHHPESPEVHFTLGELLHRAGELDAALEHLKLCAALAMAPHNTRLTMAREQDAEPPLTREALMRAFVAANTRIAVIYRESLQFSAAAQYARAGLALDRAQPDALNALGAVYNDMVRTDLAAPCFLAALENAERSYDVAGPANLRVSATINLAQSHFIDGDNAEAIACNMRASALGDGAPAYQNALLCSINGFLELADKGDILRAHERINGFYEAARASRPFPLAVPPRAPGARVRVGIVSSDFLRHVAFSFISSFLLAFDAARIELTCYLESRPTDISRPRAAEIRYREIHGLSAAAAAQLVRDDGIDVLLDLNGHTGKNRLDVFALRPARAQASYLGYPFGTGLAEMDFRLTDAHCDSAAASQPLYREKLVFVRDCFLCFNPDVHTGGARAALLPPPFARDRAALTLGCFARSDKLSAGSVALYNAILERNARVRLAVKSRGLRNPAVRARFLARFAPEVRARVSFMEYNASYLDHLAAYNEVDVSIDTFPYSGTTTCCDSLLMGTPMFTLRDEVHHFHAHNVASSILRNTHADLEFFVLRDAEAVHARIADLQAQPEAFWRAAGARVQAQFLAGPICDRARYARNLEAAIQQMHDGA